MKWNKIYSKHLKVVVRGNVNVGHTFELPPSLPNYKIILHLRLETGLREGPKECILYGQLGRGGRTGI